MPKINDQQDNPEEPQNVFYLSSALNLSVDDNKDGAKKSKSMTGQVYSGQVMYDWWGDPFIIDLATTEVADNMPLLYEHKREGVIGVVNSFTKGTALSIDGELFSDIDETARVINEKSERGVKYQMSMGLFDAKADYIDSGSNVVINGQTFSQAITVLRGGKIRESSIVILGYDDETNAAFFSKDSKFKGEDMPGQKDDGQLQAQVDELTAKLELTQAALDKSKDELLSAEQKIQQLSKSARKEKVEKLFSALGKEYTDEAAAKYFSMDDDTFATVAGDFLGAKSGAPDSAYQSMDFGAQDAPDNDKNVINRADIFAVRKGQG